MDEERFGDGGRRGTGRDYGNGASGALLGRFWGFFFWDAECTARRGSTAAMRDPRLAIVQLSRSQHSWYPVKAS